MYILKKVSLIKLTMIQLIKKLFNQGLRFSALHYISNTQIRDFGSESLNTHQELEI